MIRFQKEKFDNNSNDPFLCKEYSVLHFNVAKLLKEQDLQKLNRSLTVKPISIGLIGYLCAFIFEPYAEDKKHRDNCPR